MSVKTSDSRARAADLLSVLMIGDGVLGLLRPAQHCQVWDAGPRWWRDAVEWFADRPAVTRAVAAAALGAGLWLASAAEQRAPAGSTALAGR